MGHRVSKVIVIGVHHRIQNLEILSTTLAGKASESRQKEALKARLLELVSQHRPQLMGEEEKPGAACIGKQLSDAQGIRYCPLSMQKEERLRAGIPDDYYKTRETKRAVYKVFESYMFDQIQENRGDATSILIICGSDHGERLAKLFEKAGDEVQWEDTYFAEWFCGIPTESAGEMTGHDKKRPEI
jgi:hypothetical protein